MKNWLVYGFIFWITATSYLFGADTTRIQLWNRLQQSPPSLSNSQLFCTLAEEISLLDPILSNEIIQSLIDQPFVKENDDLFGKCLLIKASNLLTANQPEQAEKILKLALRKFETANDTNGQLKALSQLGDMQMKQKEFQKAKLYFETAEILARDNKNQLLYANTLLDLVDGLFEMNDTSRVKIQLNRAEMLVTRVENTDLLENIYLHQATFYSKSGDQNRRLEYLKKALDLSRLHDNLEQKETILIELSRSALQQGDTLLGLEFLEAAHETQKIFFKQNRTSIQDRYNLILENIPEIKTEKSTYIYFWSIFLGLFILILLYLLTKSKKTRKQLLSNIEKLNSTNEELQSELIDFKIAVELQLNKSILVINNEIEAKADAVQKLEQAIEFAKQSEYLKDMFLTKLSHEVRSPLTTILGFTSLLETELAEMENQELYEYASTITQSGQSLIDLLNNLFELSLINSNKLKVTISTFNIHELMNEVALKFEHLSSQKGIRIVVSPGELALMESDIKLIKNMLTMILDNSVRFTEKGYIKMSAEYDEGKKQVVIQIKDTGIGIDKAYIQDVFEPYRKEKLGYSTIYQGAGLSLPLTKKITEILGGIINLESKKGIGTTVHLSLPMKYQKVTIANANQPFDNKNETLNERIENRSILLVEPDKLNQLIVKKMLGNTAQIQVVGSKELALTLLNELAVNNQHFDLIMMDVNVLDATDEIQFLQKIKSEYPSYQYVPVVALAAYSLSDEPRNLVENGFAACIAKPIIKSDLMLTVNQVLETKE
ncbi:MAG: hypothetical protein A2W85_01340 [Bacteroidetes bacterium GWF2_41_31]|nr:MAG: hypothetical protein A2W85_01340 [Bacteroidetes bacterium GWF2_41_31]